MSALRDFMQKWFRRQSRSKEEAPGSSTASDKDNEKINGLGIGFPSKSLTSQSPDTAMNTSQLANGFDSPEQNRRQDPGNRKAVKTMTFSNPYGAESSVTDHAHAHAHAHAQRQATHSPSIRSTKRASAPSFRSMGSRFGGLIPTSSSRSRLGLLRNKASEVDEDAIVAPTGTDSGTMDLARRLDEIEMALSDGMLDADEARMLRASVFEKNVSSLDRRPNTAGQEGRSQPSQGSDSASYKASEPGVKETSDTATLHTVRTRNSASVRLSSFIDTASSLGGRRSRRNLKDDSSSIRSATRPGTGSPSNKPQGKATRGLLNTRQFSSRSVASMGNESRMSGHYSEAGEVNPSETAADLRQEISALKRELRRVLQAWDGVELKLLRDGADSGVGSQRLVYGFEDPKSNDNATSGTLKSSPISKNHSKRSSKDSIISTTEREMTRTEPKHGTQPVPRKPALKTTEDHSTRATDVPPPIPPKDLPSGSRPDIPTQHDYGLANGLNRFDEDSNRPKSQSNGFPQRSPSGRSSGSVITVPEVIERVPFAVATSPKPDSDASLSTGTISHKALSPGKSLSARFAEISPSSHEAKSPHSRQGVSPNGKEDSQLSSLNSQLDRIRGKRNRMQAKYDKRIDLLEAKLKAAEIRERGFGLFGGKG